MRTLIKHTLVIVGIVLILIPVIGPRIFPNTLIASLFKSFPQPTAHNQQPITNSPYSPTTYIARAKTLIDETKKAPDAQLTAQLLKNAHETLNEGIHFYPNSASLYGLRGELYGLLQGTVADSALFGFRDFTKAAQLDPHNPLFARTAAQLAMQLNQYDEAVKLLQLAVTHNKDNPELLLALAQAQTSAGDLSAAVASYTTLLTLLPTGSTEAKAVKNERSDLATLLAHYLDEAEKQSSVSSEVATVSPVFGGVAITIPSSVPSIPPEVVLSNDGSNPYVTNDSNALSGTAVLPKGSKNITIKNSNVTSTSPIYVNPTSNATNQPLYVSSKQNSSFTVSIDKATEGDIVFKWWIR